MDNISELLGPLLSDPETVKQLQDMADQLGIGNSQEPEQEQEQNHGENSDNGFSINFEMFEAISKIGPLLSELNKEDDASRLLHAIRPYLGEERRKKADEAEKILGLIRIMSLLGDQKLF